MYVLILHQESLRLLERYRKARLLLFRQQLPAGFCNQILPDIPFEVIFVTAYDSYAIQAIRFSALDYLLKTIDPEELMHAVELPLFPNNPLKSK